MHRTSSDRSHRTRRRTSLLLALAGMLATSPLAAQTAPAQPDPIAPPESDDRDRDGIPDAIDQCPDAPEDFNGEYDDDGCADGAANAPRPSPRPDGDEITTYLPLVARNALFVHNARAIVDAVVRLLTQHPRITQVTIAAHSDARGADAWNLRVSQMRAEWVRDELIRRGIDPSRVVARGFGEYCPVDPRAVPAAWQRNRRVVFRVTASTDPRFPVRPVGCAAATAAMGRP
jgi:hypothetical protein